MTQAPRHLVIMAAGTGGHIMPGLAVADEMATRSLSYNGALQDLGTLLHRIALAQTVPAAVPSDLPEYADIVRLAGAFDAEEVQLYYQIAVHGRNEIGLAPDEYAGFTMALMRMLAFKPAGEGGARKASGAGSAVAAPRAQAVAPARAIAPATAAAHSASRNAFMQMSPDVLSLDAVQKASSSMVLLLNRKPRLAVARSFHTQTYVHGRSAFIAVSTRANLGASA